MNLVTTIRCYFEVLGYSYDPAELTTALGIEPTGVRRMGEQPRAFGRPSKYDLWSLKSGKVESVDLQEVALPLLRRLMPVADTLAAYVKTHQLEVWFSATIYAANNQMAALALGSDVVQMLCTLGAALDIDVLLV